MLVCVWLIVNAEKLCILLYYLQCLLNSVENAVFIIALKGFIVNHYCYVWYHCFCYTFEYYCTYFVNKFNVSACSSKLHRKHGHMRL